MKHQRAQVPCNGCRLCCQGDSIVLHPELGDIPEKYQTEPFPAYGPKGLMLAHKPNGECIYLGESGCTIHDRAPAICREFDCRRFAEGMSYTKARKYVSKGMVRVEVIHQGRKLAGLKRLPL